MSQDKSKKNTEECEKDYGGEFVRAQEVIIEALRENKIHPTDAIIPLVLISTGIIGEVHNGIYGKTKECSCEDRAKQFQDFASSVLKNYECAFQWNEYKKGPACPDVEAALKDLSRRTK